MARWIDDVHGENIDDALPGNELLFVDFYADWCDPCQAVAPVVERVARECAGRVRFVKLNVDHNPRTASRFGNRSVPTMMLFKDGRRLAGLSGYQTEHNLRMMVGSHAPEEAPVAPPQRAGLLARLLRRAS